MKRIKIVLIVITLMCCMSCKDKWQKSGYEDYTDFTEHDLNSLKSPVILIGKVKSMGRYNITVKDSTGFIRAYGNMSYMVNSIGSSRQIGDTIK